MAPSGDDTTTPELRLVPDAQARAASPPGDEDPFDPDGLGLALSGGGYKAAAYHLGALVRLNELGLLRRLKRISSVSGGSITAAYLGLRWKDLSWSGEVATNFGPAVFDPLSHFLRTADIDKRAGITGLLLPFTSGGDQVAGAYRRRLYGGATLQDLPADSEGPRFVILATNYELNSLWRFSRAYAADYRVGMIETPSFPLARLVAASSGFPPFFCPLRLDFGDHEVKPARGADRHEAPFTRRAELADGGIYDNMGVEPIWKRYGVLLISNAGDPFRETSRPPRNWFSMLRRILGMIHRHAENNRVRQFIAMAHAKERHLVYWPLRNAVDDYRRPGPLALSPEEVALVHAEPVRLASLEAEAFRRLVRHGYSLADAATRSFPVPGQGDSPPRWPC